MKFIDRLLGRKSYSITDLAAEFGLSTPAKSGIKVGITQALRLSVVFACLRVLGEGVAQVPFKVMKKTGRSIDTVPDHPLYDVLANSPNDWMTSFELRELLVWHVGLTGRAYCFINRDSQGSPMELIPFQPGSVVAEQGRDYSIRYRVTSPSGGQATFPAESIWHLRGPSWNSFEGLDVLSLAREAVGLGIAAEEHHARVHKNSAQPSGLFSVQGQLGADAYKVLREWLEKEHQGLQNVSRPMILDRGATFTPFSFKGVDMQHLETRFQQINEVCRYFRMMPIMVGHADKALAYASSEQMFLAHLVHTLMPWYTRIEQSANKNLLTPKDRKSGHYTKLLERGLVRGSMKDEADYLSKLVERGVLTRNEARELMDRNPIDGLDEPLTPMNLMGDAKSDADDEPPKGQRDA